MDIETRIDLIKQVGEEIVTEEELRELLKTKSKLTCYDGFEPSGRIHIAQGLLRAVNVNKMTKAGIKFKMLAADWHGWANNKLGGDLAKIQTCGDYMTEVWKVSGMNLDKVEFVRSSDLLAKETYWKTVMRIARTSTVQRIIRCGEIMGRQESQVQQASQIIYPCMQAADVFELEADITQLGMDQRKVNMLAREVGPSLGFWKPVVVSHHMLMGLAPPPTEAKDAIERAIAMKMSKSNPDSAIFMLDTEEEVSKKLNKAYCPEKQLKDNPILEYCQHILFEKLKSLNIERPEKFGGNISVASYSDLTKLYSEGKIHPLDLKKMVAKEINKLLQPVRDHFTKNKKAMELAEQVHSFQVTR